MTSGVTDTAIEVAGRRLNPQALPEWQLLLTHLEISEGFSFVVLLVPDVDWANACRLALSHSLDSEGKSLQTVNFSGPEDFKTQLPGRLLNLHVNKRTGAVWLEQTISEASPQYSEWHDAWRGFVARLNQLRNPLRRQFNVPLIFVGASWLQVLIRENAPDLWSVRTLVTRIQPSDERAANRFATEGTSEQELEGVAIDPDLALRAAARLRGQVGKDLMVAQFLYRAGLGLFARSQWKEAEAVVREALDLQRQFQMPDESIASSLLLLGKSLNRQYRFDEADTTVQQAQALNASTGNILSEANCIEVLGEIALDRSDYATARLRYEEALSIYRRNVGVIGEANCLFSLGQIALDLSDQATAQAHFEEALSLYRRYGNILGEANCVGFLGRIALDRSDQATAQARFEEALSLFRRVGDMLGEANCIRNLGHIALDRSDQATAQARFEEALSLHHRVGDVLGEANCIRSLGDIARFGDSPSEAQARYLEALKLFEQIAESFSIGWTHVKLARLQRDSAAQKVHLDAARKAWIQIDRPDLIKDLEAEFNTTEK